MKHRSSGATVRQRLRYYLDNSLSKGVTMVLFWVGVALVGLVLIVALLMWLGGFGPLDREVPLPEALWISLTRSLDPGTFGQDTGDHFRMAGFVVTIGGLLAVALVIGLVSNAVDQRLYHLRRGRSIVIEHDHTLILGFSSKLPIVVAELVRAHESDKGHAIVILTPNDKVELEEMLRRDVTRQGKTRIVVRRGEPGSISDLAQVRPELAKSIVILRPDQTAADAEVVQMSLAVLKSREGQGTIPVIVELEDESTARSLREAVPGRLVTVVSKEVVARIAAQTSRASGLGAIYQELLDFDGDEFYLVPAPPQAQGRPFGEVLLLSPNCSLVGVVTDTGAVSLSPDFDYIVAPGDTLVLIATDDSVIQFDAAAPEWERGSNRTSLRAESRIEKTLMVGWNQFAANIAKEIDHHVLGGSQLHVLIDPTIHIAFPSESAGLLTSQTLTVHEGSTVHRSSIEEALRWGPFDHVMILCVHETAATIESDARALLALMHVRNCLDEQGASRTTNVVTEVMRSQAVELARVARPDDFIVSQRLVSLLIAQLAESPERMAVIEDILDAHGTQVALHDVERYLPHGTYTFREIIVATRPYGAVVIGWQARLAGAGSSYLADGIRINPEKTESITLGHGDRLILLVRH